MGGVAKTFIKMGVIISSGVIPLYIPLIMRFFGEII